MTARGLRQEIRQGRPFGSAEQEAYLGLLRTAAELEHQTSELLRPYGITPTQYNALRILRGAGRVGLCRNDVRDRLVARVPDATRLLDRMEALGLIAREREAGDRRFVTARITAKGAGLLEDLDAPMLELHRRQLSGLEPAEVATLIELLERVRDSDR